MGFYLKIFMGRTPAPRSPVVGGTWPRRSLQGAMLHGHRREAPRSRTAYHWTSRSWCVSHEVFEVKTPV